MKPKEFIQRLKDLKVRRFEKNEYANSVEGGKSSIDFENTPLQDLFTTCITQGQYLRYEDVPAMKEGENPGYSRTVPETMIFAEEQTGCYSLALGYNTICEIYKDTTGFHSSDGK